MMDKTVYHALSGAAKKWPNRPAFEVMPETAKTYNITCGPIKYSAVLEKADEWANRFEAARYCRGMRVAVLLENRPMYFMVWAGLNRIGASIVPINPDLRRAELEYLFAHSEPALIVALPSRLKELRLAAVSSGVKAEVIAPDDPIPAPREQAVVTEQNPLEQREAALLYTSGTTGSPKGCVLSNTYFLSAGRWYADLGGLANLSVDRKERMITPLPVFHMNAMAYSFMAMVTVGGCLITLDRFHPKTWWPDVAASGATCLHYLGIMPSVLMGFPEQAVDRTHQVRFGFGAGVDPKLQQNFEARFGFPLIEAWAMTETGAGAVIAAYQVDRLVGQATIGHPEGWVEAKIVDDEGAEVPPETSGELLVRNKGQDPKEGFFSFYYKDPEATSTAWKDGWFHTGDIVRRDTEGRFYFVDRKKNVIRRSGENIAAIEVESVLMRHPAIKAAGVAAVPDAMRGDEVFACLQVADPSPNLAHEIAKWGLENMAYYKIPGYIAFVDELPLTPTQKIQRASLKTLASSLIGHPDTITLTHLKKRQVI